MKQSVMLYTGHSILEAGLRKKDLSSQAQGLMILAEFAAVAMNLGQGDWPKHVSDLVNEGLDKDVSEQILPEAVAHVIARLAFPSDILAEQALFKIKEVKSTGDVEALMRAFMARMFLIELDAMRAGEALELEERVERTLLDIPPAMRPSDEQKKFIIDNLNRILTDEEVLAGYMPLEPGTPVSGALALRVAIDAFGRGDEDETSAALARLGDELEAQNKGQVTKEQCVEIAAKLLRNEYKVEVPDVVVDRAKRRDFPTRYIMVGGPAGAPPPGTTLH